MANTSLSSKMKLAIALAALGLNACDLHDHGDSHVRYLTESDEQCVPHDAARMDYINNLPAGFLTGYQGNQMDVAKNRLAGIPDRDLGHLLWTFGNGRLSGVKPGFLFPGVAGLTTLVSGATKGGFRGMVATGITTGATQAGFALQHEVGHAVEIVAREAAQKTEYSNFDQALRDVLSELNSKGGLIRGYAKSSPSEAWAESYANYYCSPKTQAFIRTNLPRTFKFLQAVLEPARWDSGSPAPSPTPAPAPAPSPIVQNPPVSLPPTSTPGNLPVPPVDIAANTEEGGSIGSWLDRMTQKVDQTLLSVTESVKQAFLQSAEGNVQAIRMAVVDGDDEGAEAGVMFAADEDIDRLTICFEAADACKAKRALAATDEQAAIAKRKVIKERNFFGTHFVRADQVKYLEQPFTVLGYDESGALVASRRFMLVGKAKNAK